MEASFFQERVLPSTSMQKQREKAETDRNFQELIVSACSETSASVSARSPPDFTEQPAGRDYPRSPAEHSSPGSICFRRRIGIFGIVFNILSVGSFQRHRDPDHRTQRQPARHHSPIARSEDQSRCPSEDHDFSDCYPPFSFHGSVLKGIRPKIRIFRDRRGQKSWGRCE